MYTDSLGTRHGLHGDDRSSPLPASLPGDSTQPLANAAEGDGPENLLSNIIPYAGHKPLRRCEGVCGGGVKV